MIYTFYSFKGGVGRSMAMANIAYLLYREGLRIVVVDWDLEAPGIEKYFFDDKDSISSIQSRPGLIDLLHQYKRIFHSIDFGFEGHDVSYELLIEKMQPALPDLESYLQTVLPENLVDIVTDYQDEKNLNKLEQKAGLWLLTAGLRPPELFPAYAQAVQNFDWADFYNSYNGEIFFEWMRRELEKFADVILIDSRTGVTEMGGISTRQLADVVVLLAAPNEQNVEGVKMMAQSLSRKDLITARKERSLKLTFIPSRIEDSEAEALEDFRTFFDEQLSEYYPKDTHIRNIFTDFRIPYIPYYSFRETLASKNPDFAIANELIASYRNIAEHLGTLAPHSSMIYKVYHPDEEHLAEEYFSESGQISLKDILISARKESHKMRHFYLGVEHIFIALLEIQAGLTSSIISDTGLTPEYVINSIRSRISKGGRHRLWAGIPNTPRADVVFGNAQGIAQKANRTTILERDLLTAILEEGRSIPVRVLILLSIDIEKFTTQARERVIRRQVSQSIVNITLSDQFKDKLNDEEMLILKRMFRGYSSILVTQKLRSRSSNSQILIVTPIQLDGREASKVFVKIGSTDAILDEAQRYNKYVKDTLPPLTARLEDKPVAPESSDFAGLKYTSITESDELIDIHSIVHKWTPERFGKWLTENLYDGFGEKWWKQKRPYRFEAWREYDWLLPPILTLKFSRDLEKPKGATILRFPMGQYKITALDLGEVVAVQNFLVYKVEPERGAIRLALAQGESTARAYQIEVQGIDFEKDTYFRGEIIDQLVGTVWKTRSDELMESLAELEPDFEIHGNSIVINGVVLPNPVKVYTPMLDTIIMGTISTIHGHLYLENIHIGPNESALLIDFSKVREGQTLYDWATLSLDIFLEMTQNGETWDELIPIAEKFVPLLMGNIDREDTEISILHFLQEIVSNSLEHQLEWAEFQAPIFFQALHIMCGKQNTLFERKIAFLIAAFAAGTFNNRKESTSDSDRTDAWETID